MCGNVSMPFIDEKQYIQASYKNMKCYNFQNMTLECNVNGFICTVNFVDITFTCYVIGIKRYEIVKKCEVAIIEGIPIENICKLYSYILVAFK